MTGPKSLIINSPYDRPDRHWRQVRDSQLDLANGRREAGYEIFDTRNNTRRTVALDLVNRIRQRVDEWREADYPGITSVTRSLLRHWHDRSAREKPFYYCQLEAVESLIWWVESTPEFRQSIFLQGDGGTWERLCNKMATGSGKTAVMAMIITWQALNAITYPKRNKEFSRAIFIVAPGITVRDRLQVLLTGHDGNYYDQFNLCPSESLRQKLNDAVIQIENWHSLMPLKAAKRSVVKKGKESDKAYVKRVLGRLADNRDIVVLNDEAHHAYRIPADIKIKRTEDFDEEQATRWIEGLDRIHKEIRIQRCFDLSATPFAPTGKTNTEQGLFEWIISDFGLNDAIEAGLVKTPRIVIRDGIIPDTQTLKPRLYHLYRDPSVSDDLNRLGALPKEPLPALVQQAYTLLGADWRSYKESWEKAGHVSPPVLLTVCNRTETAARIEYYFNRGDAHWPELKSPNRTLRVDSKVLEKAERGESAGKDKSYETRLKEIVAAAALPSDRKEKLKELKKEELLRELVDTVGKRGQAGQELQNVVSVAMLSEGWDAKNVTHILGLRAFTSQLLCEQVIGRGLRRVAYDTETVIGEDGIERKLFKPEYVNVFGVPLSIFQDVGEGAEPPVPVKPSTQIETLPERNSLEIRWPNILRIDAVVKPTLSMDWETVRPLRLDPAVTPLAAEIAPAIGGAADWSQIKTINLEEVPEEFRLQRLIFRAARKAFDRVERTFHGNRNFLAVQLIHLVEQFLKSDRLEIPSLFHQEAERKRLLISLNMDAVVQHVMQFVVEQNVERLEPIFDEDAPIGSTREMRTWYTTKLCQPTQRSQISHVVTDSAWEAFAANTLETGPLKDLVDCYAKNDHLGFVVRYLWQGSLRRYIPDFLIRLKTGKTLILEIKGEDSPQDQAKRASLKHWVDAVNTKGGFGQWSSDVVFEMAKMQDTVIRHST
jgi:type III restriction enzyme